MKNILKIRSEPPQIQALNRLLHGISSTNHQVINSIRQDIDRIQAGYKGELRVDHFIQETHFQLPIVYFPNAELQVSKYRFIQIDSLIITPSYICIFEVKNMRGILRFHENPFQLIQIVDGKKRIYDCPQSQIIRMASSLKYWLQKNNIDLPIYYKIAMPNSNTFIKKSPKKVQLLFNKEIPIFLEQLNVLPHQLNSEEFHKLCVKLQSQIKPYNPFPLCNKYNLQPENLLPGIICFCGMQIEYSIRKNQKCIRCGASKKDILQQALLDWFYLFKPTMTNRECRHYLKIEDKYIVSRLLKNMNLKSIGNTKSRMYQYDYIQPLFKN
ncbi:NERD domain-containing protein [Viridibacillus sp. YIM B01967]|uniref:NERD domain-containing protein n=1 Tax=Viridibacillus soli TaxID=2798301 RepID=A0ABS1H5V0_9BACL|nr:nuclease-related domain-containing protein [Viridibacillus soli]MBK3494798.1 NERD domain-containing protein [Viridibacillus soli]